MSMFDRFADHVAAILQDAADTEDREGERHMHQMIDDLLARGWVYTNAGRCEPGDEVIVLGDDNDCPVPDVITGASGNHVQTQCGVLDEDQLVLQAPRPEPEPEPVFERGEVWWCRDNETGKEGNLVRSATIWRGPFPGEVALAWKDDEVTPLRKLLNTDGTPAEDAAPTSTEPEENSERERLAKLQEDLLADIGLIKGADFTRDDSDWMQRTPAVPGMPEWDPEQEWPVGTVVEAVVCGQVDQCVMADPEEDDPWYRGDGNWERSSDLHDVRVLTVPGHPAPTGLSLRERLLDEETVEAVAREAWEHPTRGPWKNRAEDTKNLARKIAQLYLTIAANILATEEEQA